MTISNTPTGAPQELQRYYNRLIELYQHLKHPDPYLVVSELIKEHGEWHLRHLYRQCCEANGIEPSHPTPQISKKIHREIAKQVTTQTAEQQWDNKQWWYSQWDEQQWDNRQWDNKQ